jgi:hypothetical protein
MGKFAEIFEVLHLKNKRETVKYWAARRFTLGKNWYHFKNTRTLHMDEQKINIENCTSRIRKRAEKTRRACSWTLTSNLKEMKEKCFIGRRLISLKRESTINVFTVEEEEVLHCDQENNMTLRGKNF